MELNTSFSLHLFFPLCSLCVYLLLSLFQPLFIRTNKQIGENSLKWLHVILINWRQNAFFLVRCVSFSVCTTRFSIAVLFLCATEKQLVHLSLDLCKATTTATTPQNNKKQRCVNNYDSIYSSVKFAESHIFTQI